MIHIVACLYCNILLHPLIKYDEMKKNPVTLVKKKKSLNDLEKCEVHDALMFGRKQENHRCKVLHCSLVPLP